MKPLNKIKIEWSPQFAYAIGLLVTDGNLSSDGRHINFTSKDESQIDLFKDCLKITNVTGKKSSGSSKMVKKYFYVGFGDIIFYRFLQKLGLTPNKSKTLSEIKIPKKYFFDFLRGHFDGDGSFYSYYDKRWRSSYMFYLVFISASEEHIKWLRSKIKNYLSISGHVSRNENSSALQLRYAKADAVKIIHKMYSNPNTQYSMERKRLKIAQALAIIPKI